MANRKLIVEIIGDSRSLERAFGRSVSSSRSFTTSMRRAGLAAGAAFSGAAAGAALFVRSAASFEESMQKVVGLSGVAQGAVNRLRGEVLQLSATVGRGPQELAEGLLFITSSGVPAANAMNVLEASARAAAAGLGETKTVADAVTSVMNAYGPSIVSANRATDVLVATVREGKGEASDFAGVIGNVVSIASQLGVSFEDVGASLAAMTRLGTDAETSATQLQQVFSNLVKVSPQAEKAFRKVGLSSAGLRKQIADKGLLSGLRTIQDAFAGDIPGLAKAFGDIRALRGVLALVGNQADTTAGIFNRLGDSTGSLGDAFDAVSKTTAQQFRQLQASAKVIAIQVGAALAPLANIVARGLTAATTRVQEFFAEIGRARTVSAKVDVVWEGVEDATKGVVGLLRDAVSAVDWDAVWSRARGIADGFQEQLENIDFAVVGRRLGDAFSRAAAVALPAAKDIATRIGDAASQIDFVKIGKAAGPGLAAAMVTAITTLLDPSFWIHNWDLAIAVAIAVFPGRVAKLGARIAGEFAGVVARALGSIAPRLGQAFAGLAIQAVRGFSVIGGLIGRVLKPLEGVVRRSFKRLGGLAVFTVKVLGIQGVISAVAGFAKTVGDTFKRLATSITGALNGAWQAMARRAVGAALKIVEPFTHIPGRFGEKFRDAKDALKEQLAGMETAAGSAAKSIQSSLDSVKSKTVTLSFKVTGLDALQAGVDKFAAAERAKATPDSGLGALQAGANKFVKSERAAKAKREGAAVERAANAAAAATKAAAAKVAKIAAATAAAVKEAREKQRTSFDALFDALSLEVEVAAASKGFADDIRKNNKLQAAIRAQIKVEGRTTELAQALFAAQQDKIRIQGEIADAADRAAKKAAARRQASQFRALGLTAEGGELVPTIANLRKQLAALTTRLVASGNNVSLKVRNQLAGVRKVLSGELGKATVESREKIKELFQTIRGTFDSEAKTGPLTATTALNANKLLEGMGLGRDMERELRARLSRFNSAGLSLTRPSGTRTAGGVSGGFFVPVVESHVTVNLDGQKLTQVVTKSQSKTGRGTKQKRGPNRRIGP